jgi:hypothetical protein
MCCCRERVVGKRRGESGEAGRGTGSGALLECWGCCLALGGPVPSLAALSAMPSVRSGGRRAVVWVIVIERRKIRKGDLLCLRFVAFSSFHHFSLQPASLPSKPRRETPTSLTTRAHQSQPPTEPARQSPFFRLPFSTPPLPPLELVRMLETALYSSHSRRSLSLLSSSAETHGRRRAVRPSTGSNGVKGFPGARMSVRRGERGSLGTGEALRGV